MRHACMIWFPLASIDGTAHDVPICLRWKRYKYIFIPSRADVCCNLTVWAMQKATNKSVPGLSQNDQFRDRVTKMRAWLTMLTCKYTAATSWSWSCRMSCTWKVLCETKATISYTIITPEESCNLDLPTWICSCNWPSIDHITVPWETW